MSDTKRKLILGTWVTVLSFVFLSTATYAWMTISDSLRVSDLELNVVTDNALELALDVDGEPGGWTTLLSLGDLVAPETELRPATWSHKDQKFVTVRYGLDGRPSTLEDLTVTLINDYLQTPVPAEAEADRVEGYVIALNLWVRCGAQHALVYLSEPAERVTDILGAGTWVIGEPVWNPASVRHENGGNGAESIVRMGFRTYDEDYDTGGFVIYEPNTQENETPTPSVDGGNLEGSGKLIRQGVTTWKEQSPVLRDAVDYEVGEFIDKDTSLFLLARDVPRKFTLYIWLEGQDSGCTNAISQGKLTANVQFAGLTGLDLENIYRPTGG